MRTEAKILALIVVGVVAIFATVRLASPWLAGVIPDRLLAALLVGWAAAFLFGVASGIAACYDPYD